MQEASGTTDCPGFGGFFHSQRPPYFTALSQSPLCGAHSYPLCLQHFLEQFINAAGSASHSPSVISALLVRTFPSINLITAKAVQRIPLKTETLYRKSSWKKKTSDISISCSVAPYSKWQIILVIVEFSVPRKYATWEKDFLSYDFPNSWCLFCLYCCL